MAKVMLVPDWLGISPSIEELDKLCSELCSPTVSNRDVNNYHLAQWNFLKFLTGVSNRDKLYSMYNELYQLNLSNDPELTIALDKDDVMQFDVSYLCEGLSAVDGLYYDVKQSADGQILYVLCKNINANNAGEVSSVDSMFVIKLMLKAIDSGIQLLGERTDNAAVFRNTPIITQLYVKRLMSC